MISKDVFNLRPHRIYCSLNDNWKNVALGGDSTYIFVSKSEGAFRRLDGYDTYKIFDNGIRIDLWIGTDDAIHIKTESDGCNRVKETEKIITLEEIKYDADIAEYDGEIPRIAFFTTIEYTNESCNCKHCRRNSNKEDSIEVKFIVEFSIHDLVEFRYYIDDKCTIRELDARIHYLRSEQKKN